MLFARMMLLVVNPDEIIRDRQRLGMHDSFRWRFAVSGRRFHHGNVEIELARRKLESPTELSRCLLRSASASSHRRENRGR